MFTWKWLGPAALVTITLLLLYTNSFEQPIGREFLQLANETLDEKVKSTFDEVKSARIPSRDELLNPEFSKLDIEKEPHEGNGRTLMIVAFERTPASMINVEFLMRQVVGGPRARDLDFIFVDTSVKGPFECFPQLPNVLYVHRKRYLVLMNGSVRGPFSTAFDFLEIVKQQLTNRTPVVGTSVGCWPRPHLQSMFLLMNSVGIDLINATLSCDVAHRTAAIFGPHGEINLSRNVLQQGYNLGALQRIWRGRNFRNGSAMTQMCTLMKNDPYSPKKDRDPLTLEDILPDDVIFFKTTRRAGQDRLSELSKRFTAECADPARADASNDGDACEAFASEPLEELLHSFSEGQDGALVVCGPQRVRSLLGSTGSPGVLALAMAQCANALPAHSLLAFSAFFALPEVDLQARCRLPCLDLMDGCRRACWEQCNIETFTDMHKAFSVLVRCCSALLDGSFAKQKWQQHQDCLGRLPLIFCLQLLRPVDRPPGLIANRLFFVEAPPPVSGGPVPQHFFNATARLQMGRCVVLHAALGGAPSNAALRSALGPLQRLAQKDGKAQAISWDLRPLCRAMVLQAEKAAQDIWQLCSLLRRCSEDEERLGSVGVPCCDAAKLWTASFGGIRQITLSELRRQYPLAVLRAKTLRTLLLSMQDWEDKAAEVALDEAVELLKSFDTVDCNRNGELLVEVASLTWQQQWQVRHLVGCIHAAEERDQLVSEVEDLTEDLVATQEELSQQLAQQKDYQQVRQASEEEWEWQLQQERGKCEELAAQLAMSQEDVQLLRQQLVQLEAMLADEQPRTPETPAPEKKLPRRRQSEWLMQERVKELEALVGQLQREQREDREILRATCAHRDRLQLQLRREANAATLSVGHPRAPRVHASRSTQSSSKESSTVAAELVSPTLSPL